MHYKMYAFSDCDSDLQYKYDFTKAQTASYGGGGMSLTSIRSAAWIRWSRIILRT